MWANVQALFTYRACIAVQSFLLPQAQLCERLLPFELWVQPRGSPSPAPRVSASKPSKHTAPYTEAQPTMPVLSGFPEHVALCLLWRFRCSAAKWSVQGQVGWGFEQPGLVEGVPAHGSGIGTRWSLRSLPTHTLLWFCDNSHSALLRVSLNVYPCGSPVTATAQNPGGWSICEWKYPKSAGCLAVPHVLWVSHR